MGRRVFIDKWKILAQHYDHIHSPYNVYFHHPCNNFCDLPGHLFYEGRNKDFYLQYCMPPVASDVDVDDDVDDVVSDLDQAEIKTDMSSPPRAPPDLHWQSEIT